MTKQTSPVNVLATGMAWAKGQQVILMVVTTIFLPLAESLLAGVWGSMTPPASTLAAWILAGIAFLHVVLAVLVFVTQALCPQSLAVDALQLRAELDSKTRELARRNRAYSLTREAFERLTAQTCMLEFGGYVDSNRGFEAALMPIVEPLLKNAQTVLGVTSGQFTLEVYLPSPALSSPGQPESVDLHFFYSPSIKRTCAERLIGTSCCLAKWAEGTDVAFQQHIDDNKQLFYGPGKCKAEIYFRRFAIHPIWAPCGSSAPPAGRLVVTSMQDEPFADDFPEAMGFFAAIITRFHKSCDDAVMLQTGGTGAGPS